MTAGNPNNRRVFMIELLADTSTLVEGMEIVVMQMDDVLKSVSQVDTSLQGLGSVFERVGKTVGSRMDVLGTSMTDGFSSVADTVRDLFSPLKEITTVLRAIVFSINSQTTRMQKGFTNLSRKIQGTTNVVKASTEAFSEMRGEMKRSQESFTQLGAASEKDFSRMKKSAQGLGSAFVVTAGDLYRAYAKLKGIITSMVEEAAQLQQTLELTLPHFQRITENVGLYAESLTRSIFPANELAKATRALGRAGVVGGEALLTLGEHATMMSRLIGKSSEESVNFLADLKRALRVNNEAIRGVAGALSVMHTELMASTEVLMRSAKASLASARALGVSTKNAMSLGAAFEKMGASAGGAAQMLSNLMERTTSFDQMWKVSALSGMGAQEFVKQLKSNDPIKAIHAVSTRLMRMSEFERTRYLKNILGFSEEEALIWSNIARQPSRFAMHIAEANRVMEESNNLTKRFGARTMTLNAQWSLLTQQFGNLQTRLAAGITPVLTTFVSVLRELLHVISYIPTPLLAAVGAILAVATAPVAGILVLSTFINAFSKLSSFVGSAREALMKFVGAKKAEQAALAVNKMSLLENVSTWNLLKMSVWGGVASLERWIAIQWLATKRDVVSIGVKLGLIKATKGEALITKYNAGIKAIEAKASYSQATANASLTGSTLMTVKAAVAGAAAWIYNAAAKGLSTAATWAQTAAMWALNNVPIVLTVVAIAGAMYYLYKAFGPVTAAVGGLTIALIALAVAFYSTPIGWIAAGIAALIGLVWSFWDPIKKVFGYFFDVLNEIVSTVWSFIQAVYEVGSLFFLVSNPIGWTLMLFKFFGDEIAAVMDTIYSVFEYAGQTLYAVFVSPIYRLVDLFKMVGNAVWDTLGAAFQKLKNVVELVRSGISSLFSAIKKGIDLALAPLRKLREGLNWIKDAASNAKSGLFGSGFLHITEGIGESLPSVLGLSNAFTSMGNVAANTASKVASISASAAAAAGGIGRLAEATNKLQGVTVRGVSVVKQVIADTSAEGSPIAAEAAAALRGAVVSPAAMLPPAPAPAAEAGGGGEISITVPLMLDGEQIASAVAKITEEDLMRHHGRPSSAMRGVPL